ncbi:MAG: 4-alpha-glucanotransferase, partial [Candidatus Latescibacteria bacterium]|nr:4-alpha-glucanotransferase [Candidatus Latescibacterota bacterium]
MPRASGVLLHPTSLPGRFGIGDLGAAASQFLDVLAESGQRLWQVLPLGPTGLGDSPYACFSAFAGNPLLISLDRLAEDGLLSQDDLRDVPVFPERTVDYGRVIEWKDRRLYRAFVRFMAEASPADRADWEGFCRANQSWLDDYALFMALKDAHGGAAWTTWPSDIATRQPDAIARWTEKLADRVAFHRYAQYTFDRQWAALKRYAHDYGIEIVGDIPIFVAHNSA